MSMIRCQVYLIAAALGFGLIGMAKVQAEEKSGGLDIERFKPALDSQGLVLTEAGQSEMAGDLNLGFYLHYAHRPLVVTDPDGKYVRSLVEDRFGASFIISMGLTDWLTVGIEVPTAFYQDGVYLDPSGVDTGLAGAGLGDIRIAPKLTILRQSKHGISLAFLAPVSLPSGDEGAFLGSDSVTGMPTLALSRSLLGGALMLAANLGSWIQGGTSYQDLDTSHELFYRVGARVRLIDWLSASGEVSGAARIATIGENKPKETPLECLLAVRLHTRWDMHFTLGGAVGALPGWGTPQARGFFGLAWSPRVHDRDEDGIDDDKDRCPNVAGPRENDGCPWGDSDSDGLTDDKDNCPQEPGPVENNGCPWGDADKDGLTDNQDKCPNEAGPAENSGCPWGDADGDGLTDNVDKCPQMAGPAENDGCPFADADGDGIKDGDDVCPNQAGPIANAGCPWGDTDKDGLKDNVDKCPREKEDKDGFEDEDGCPDRDNDKDGVPDDKDKCRDEPETINGYKDEDGCPDKGKVVVVVKKSKIEILQKIYFATGRAVIRRRSYSLLNQVAQTIRGHQEIAKIRVEGHTDSQGSDAYNQRLSQRRANAVRRYLVRRGVEPGRLEAAGYGESRPIDTNATAAGREQNRRVEFVIVEQE